MPNIRLFSVRQPSGEILDLSVGSCWFFVERRRSSTGLLAENTTLAKFLEYGDAVTFFKSKAGKGEVSCIPIDVIMSDLRDAAYASDFGSVKMTLDMLVKQLKAEKDKTNSVGLHIEQAFATETGMKARTALLAQSLSQTTEVKVPDSLVHELALKTGGSRADCIIALSLYPNDSDQAESHVRQRRTAKA